MIKITNTTNSRPPSSPPPPPSPEVTTTTWLNLILLSYFFQEQPFQESRLSNQEINLNMYLRMKERLLQGDPLHSLSPNWIHSSRAHLAWTTFLSQTTPLANHFLWQTRHGVRFLFPHHEFYPSRFMNLPDPPFLISYLGNPIWLTDRGLAIVGSREPSLHSLKWMEEHLGKTLQQESLYTVSGGARGVDEQAHRISLLHRSPTIILLPSGLGEIYPQRIHSYLSLILQGGGAILTEYPYHQKIKKFHFQRRNRLIPGLAIATLVIEAREKSGTLVTAQKSIDQGRPLLVLPSHPMDPQSRGSLNLICEGATPVRDSTDLLMYLRSELS